MIWILIVILGVGLDQWTKYWAVSELAVRGDMAVIDPLFISVITSIPVQRGL